MNAVALMHRPCGACGQLVSVRDGCEHWQPDTARKQQQRARDRERNARDKREARARAREQRLAEQREVVERFRRMMSPDGVPALGPGGRPRVTG